MKTTRLMMVLALALAGCGIEGEILDEGEEEYGESSEELSWAPVCYSAERFHIAKNGDLHSHTSFSDGSGTPDGLFDKVRSASGDFDVVTDHANGTNASRWQTCKQMAGNNTGERFLAGCGHEQKIENRQYTHHVVTLFPDFLDGWDRTFGTQPAYLEQLKRCRDCVAIFAHPASNLGPLVPWQPQDLNPDANAKFDAIELNGEAPAAAIRKYLQFLDAGFKVSPVYNSDTHSQYAGAENGLGAGIWVADWSSGRKVYQLRKALREHRTFASFPGATDHAIKLVKVDQPHNCMMGSVIDRQSAPTATLRVTTSGRVERMRLYANGYGIDAQGNSDAFATVSCPSEHCSCSDGKCVWERKVSTAGRKYFVARADRAGDGYMITAPIWFK